MADDQDDGKPVSEHSEHVLEREFIGEDEEIRRQVFSPRMFADDDNKLVGDYYPKSSFVFTKRDGKRAESVFWAKYCLPGLVHELGENKAESDNKKMAGSAKAKKKVLSQSALKVYVGYMTATSGAVRKLAPGALEVVHCPEFGIDAHSEIVLQPEFVGCLANHFKDDDIGGEGEIDEQTGRIIIRDLLVTLFCQNFVAVGSTKGDGCYDRSRSSLMATG